MIRIILDDKYELGGGMGSWAKSKETVTVTKGDVRTIGGILMYAYTVYSVPWYKFTGDCRHVVNWCPVDELLNNPENLRKWMRTND